MTYFQKTFCAILAVALLMATGVCVMGYFVARNQLTEQWQQSYRTQNDALGHTLYQMEQLADRILHNAVQVVSAWEEQHDLPSTDALKSLVARTQVSDLYITDHTGRFIRATNDGAAETLQLNLFDFAAEYRELLTGERDVAYTPLLPSTPLNKPCKFAMIPNHTRTRVLEASLRLPYLADIFQHVLATDTNVRSVGLYAPSGTKLGALSQADTALLTPSDIASHAPVVIDFAQQRMTLLTRIQASVDNCPECVTKGVANAGQGYFYHLLTEVSLTSLIHSLEQLAARIAAIFGLCVIVSIGVAYALARRLVAKLAIVSAGVRRVMETGDLSQHVQIGGRDEVKALADHVNLMMDALAQSQAQTIQSERDRTLVQCARQVAHDIRSPLTALRVVSHHLNELPEDKRVMIRHAVQRIEDIANDLANRERNLPIDLTTVVSRAAPSVQLLSSLIEPLISEQRIQHRGRLGVEIQAVLDASTYGVFAIVELTECKRVLSNLINNAVEAIPERGHVTVTMSTTDQTVAIVVRDTGAGIAPDVLPHLMHRELTHGKAAGSGLGLLHARASVERWGGTLTLESTLGDGTMARITLPLAPPPDWFVPAIRLQPGMAIVVMDDDSSIHQVWEERFQALRTALPVTLHHFTTIDAAIAWCQQRHHQPILFLCDYEFLGDSRTGLDVISTLQLQDNAILVTSRYEDPQIQHRCAALGLRLIPKGLAGYVPITTPAPDAHR